MLDPLSLLSIGGSLVGNIFGAQSAADAQAAAARKAAKLQAAQYADTKAMYAPTIEAGNTARGAQMSLLGLPGGGMDQGAAMEMYRSSPGYRGGLAAGTNAINTGAANAGLMRSSGNIGDLGRFGSEYDGSAFGGYFDRLAGISGQGNGAMGAVAGFGAQSAAGQGNMALQAGNAAAGGAMNMGNAGTGAAQNLMDLYYRSKTPVWAQPATAGPSAAWGGGRP